MKTRFATIVTLFSAFLQGTSISAKPVGIEGMSKRQGIPAGMAIFCTLENQCSSIRLPYDNSLVCTDFSGSFSSLYHNLANVTIDDVACSAFSDLGCTGTNYGGDIALGGTLTIDMTHLHGSDVSGSVSSIRCLFV
ncbi:hypothetical protein BDZ94DRAFT_1242714 [Collybia nuda]|uniref:Uncharacterized protein n=1 Tax=Collybia nuda TaxID=64659 RepID=A0A9P5YJ60_9AGAR|nr:hypothetical protein BDZ94DRAFT_1242714 [Collybia nuda]